MGDSTTSISPAIPALVRADDKLAFGKSLSSVEKAWRVFNLDDGTPAHKTGDYKDDKFITTDEWHEYYDMAAEYDGAWNEMHWEIFQERFNCNVSFKQANAGGGDTVTFEEFKNAMGAKTAVAGSGGLVGTSRESFAKLFLEPASRTTTRRLSKNVLEAFDGVRTLFKKKSLTPAEALEAKRLIEVFAGVAFAGKPAIDRGEFEDLMRSYNLPLGMFAAADRIVSLGDGIVEKEEMLEYLKRYFIEPNLAQPKSTGGMASKDEAEKILNELKNAEETPVPSEEADMETEVDETTTDQPDDEATQEKPDIETSPLPNEADMRDADSLLAARGYTVASIRDRVLQIVAMMNCKNDDTYCFNPADKKKLVSAMSFYASGRGQNGELGISFNFWEYFSWWVSQPGNLIAAPTIS